MIRKSPRVVDPLVALRDKTKRMIESKLSMNSSFHPKTGMWRGNSISVISNYNSKLKWNGNSTNKSQHTHTQSVTNVRDKFDILLSKLCDYRIAQK